MNIHAVCISRTVGAGGEAVGQGVAQQLGFRYVDDEIITAASERSQVQKALIAKVEHRQSLLTRLLDAIPTRPLLDPAPPVFAESLAAVELGAKGGGVSAAAAEQYRALIREAIVEMASRGSVVIVAHGASMALARAEGVLRVLVTASEKTRVERLRTSGLLNERSAAEAVEESDRARQEYLARFYDIGHELPTHYDLLLNTDVVTPTQAIGAIVGLARA